MLRAWKDNHRNISTDPARRNRIWHCTQQLWSVVTRQGSKWGDLKFGQFVPVELAHWEVCIEFWSSGYIIWQQAPLKMLGSRGLRAPRHSSVNNGAFITGGNQPGKYHLWRKVKTISFSCSFLTREWLSVPWQRQAILAALRNWNWRLKQDKGSMSAAFHKCVYRHLLHNFAFNVIFNQPKQSCRGNSWYKKLLKLCFFL